MTIALNCDATPPTAATAALVAAASGGGRPSIKWSMGGWPVVPRWVRAMHRILFGRGRPQQCRFGVKRNHSTNSASEEGISDYVTPNGGEQQLLYSPTTYVVDDVLPLSALLPSWDKDFFLETPIAIAILQVNKSQKCRSKITPCLMHFHRIGFVHLISFHNFSPRCPLLHLRGRRKPHLVCGGGGVAFQRVFGCKSSEEILAPSVRETDERNERTENGERVAERKLPYFSSLLLPSVRPRLEGLP